MPLDSSDYSFTNVHETRSNHFFYFQAFQQYLLSTPTHIPPTTSHLVAQNGKVAKYVSHRSKHAALKADSLVPNIYLPRTGDI